VGLPSKGNNATIAPSAEAANELATIATLIPPSCIDPEKMSPNEKACVELVLLNIFAVLQIFTDFCGQNVLLRAGV
jgi:hypothetical protein